MPAPPLVVEDTPNPHALKFTAPYAINPGPTRSYRQPPPEVSVGQDGPDHALHARCDALAAAIFAAGPIASVMVVRDFVTVNKKPSARWATLRPRLEKILRQHLQDAGPSDASTPDA